MTCSMTRVWLMTAMAIAISVAVPRPGVGQNLLFSENFEALELGENVDEGLAGDDPRDAVWSPEGPAGWSVDRSGVPEGGVTEWRGWSFVDPIWWDEAAGGQDRAAFTFGTGSVIAVADGDEWDDYGHADGLMNTFLTSPAIPIGGVPNPRLTFDTSWRAEDTQTATITASYDGSDPIEILRWESDLESDFYEPDLNPGTVTIPLNPPVGAENVVLNFGYTDAGNDWWWAVDNLELGDYSEDFESVVLGPNVHEGRALRASEVWTKEPPPGWNIEDRVPGQDEGPDLDGVTEWAGWSFTKKEWWIAVAEDQRRSDFTKGEGTVAVADPDEWDDNPHVDSFEAGWYNTFLATPEISLEGVEPGSVQLKFDSSWRDEFDSNYQQTANITVSFDGGEPIELLLWESDPESEFFKDDLDPEISTNETVILPIDNPPGASSMVLTFGLFDAGNDWWWAIDNIEVTAIGGGGLTGDFDGDGALGVGDLNLLAEAMVNGGEERFDLNGDGSISFADRSNWVKDLKNTWMGDANLDGEFNSGDFVTVFQAGKFETGSQAGWEQGDWNGDQLFTSSDFVVAFQDGGFEQGPRAAVAAVPEPSSLLLLLLGCLSLAARRRR